MEEVPGCHDFNTRGQVCLEGAGEFQSLHRRVPRVPRALDCHLQQTPAFLLPSPSLFHFHVLSPFLQSNSNKIIWEIMYYRPKCIQNVSTLLTRLSGKQTNNHGTVRQLSDTKEVVLQITEGDLPSGRIYGETARDADV